MEVLSNGVTVIKNPDINDLQSAAQTTTPAPEETIQNSNLGRGLHARKFGDRIVLEADHGHTVVAVDARHTPQSVNKRNETDNTSHKNEFDGPER